MICYVVPLPSIYDMSSAMLNTLELCSLKSAKRWFDALRMARGVRSIPLLCNSVQFLSPFFPPMKASACCAIVSVELTLDGDTNGETSTCRSVDSGRLTILGLRSESITQACNCNFAASLLAGAGTIADVSLWRTTNHRVGTDLKSGAE